MAQIHIKLDDGIHDKLRKDANNLNYSLQEYVDKIISYAVNDPSLFSSYTNNGKKGKGLFTFIDLFAGIGGIRLAFEKHKGDCVFSSERDKWCHKTYFEHFKEFPEGDIYEIPPNEIPDHDILTAGFPCQPFSIAGVSKKKSLGMDHGFKDKAQGTLFFRIAEILEKKRPKAFLLENVKHLQNHDQGNTFRVIQGTLKELGYEIFCDTIDAVHYVPQHRERLFIIGFDKEVVGDSINFNFPEPPKKETPKLGAVLESKVDSNYILSDKLWNYLQGYAEKHRLKGNGFGYGLFDKNDVARTLSARYFKDGSEILIKVPGSNPRRLTPRECARLMGFPETFKIPVSDTQAYKQFGNSVVVPAVAAVAGQLVKAIKPFLSSH